MKNANFVIKYLVNNVDLTCVNNYKAIDWIYNNNLITISL